MSLKKSSKNYEKKCLMKVAVVAVVAVVVGVVGVAVVGVEEHCGMQHHPGGPPKTRAVTGHPAVLNVYFAGWRPLHLFFFFFFFFYF